MSDKTLSGNLKELEADRLTEKLERLSALNALLNMDEKGDDAIGMDDAPEEESGGQEEEIPGESETEENAADAPIPYPQKMQEGCL